MKFMKNCVFFLCLASSSHGMTSEEIKTEVGTGCANKALFSSSFTTEKGDLCTECSFCSGSSITSIFNPKSSSTCINCGSNQNECTNFQVITSFDEDWRMWFVSILSSDGPIEDDPSKIIMEGSNNYNGKIGTWISLYDSSGPVFNGRGEKKTMIFNNNNHYKQYRMTFVRNKNSSKIQMGHYGIIPAYTKECTAELYEKLTGLKLSAELTSAPTNNPTSKPTLTPTNEPTTPKIPITDQSKTYALQYWFKGNRALAIEHYGRIEDWDTSLVTDMAWWFKQQPTFNDDISKWNVSRVKTMLNMFLYATSFNVDIGAWNVNQVTTMQNMFLGATSFNANLGAWDVGNVKMMQLMFNSAKAFNGNVSAWNVNRVSNMSSMFGGAESFNTDIGAWQVSNVTTMGGMFGNAKSFNNDVSAWDVSNVTTMKNMFQKAESFNSDIGSWNVAKVLDMYSMFILTQNFNANIASWNVGKVPVFQSMFQGSKSFNVDLSDWNVSHVRNFSRMFQDAESFDQKLCWKIEVGGANGSSGMFKNAKGGSVVCGI